MKKISKFLIASISAMSICYGSFSAQDISKASAETFEELQDINLVLVNPKEQYYEGDILDIRDFNITYKLYTSPTAYTERTFSVAKDCDMYGETLTQITFVNEDLEYGNTYSHEFTLKEGVNNFSLLLGLDQTAPYCKFGNTKRFRGKTNVMQITALDNEMPDGFKNPIENMEPIYGLNMSWDKSYNFTSLSYRYAFRMEKSLYDSIVTLNGGTVPTFGMAIRLNNGPYTPIYFLDCPNIARLDSDFNEISVDDTTTEVAYYQYAAVLNGLEKVVYWNRFDSFISSAYIKFGPHETMYFSKNRYLGVIDMVNQYLKMEEMAPYYEILNRLYKIVND